MSNLDVRSADSANKPSNKSSLALRRQRYTRARTGCLTCRSRRKKCDEKRPRCTGCARNGLSCSWPHLQRPQLDANEHATHDKSDEGSSISGYSTPSSDAVHEALTTTWNPSLGAFVLSNNRATSLYPSSPLLLRRYLQSTAALCTHLPAYFNPFITDVLPLATSDDLVMNVVLAMGGVHLTTESPDQDLLEIQRDTSKHYSLALQALSDVCMTKASTWDAEKQVRVLLVLVLLAHVEAIRGDNIGSVYPHLRAGWHLAQELVKNHQPAKKTSYDSLEGFAMESYAYLALVSNIIPDSLNTGRSVADDGFMTDLGWMQSYPNFGVFFSFGPDLYEKIPIICSLARDCLDLWRIEHGVQSDETDYDSAAFCSAPSSDISAIPTHLHERKKSLTSQVSSLIAWLNNWTSPEPTPNTAAFPSEHRAAGESYRHALLIYLKACCVEYDDERFVIADGTHGYYPRPSARMITEIDQHLDSIIALISEVMFGPFGATLLWAVITAGSCFTRSDHRTIFNTTLEEKVSPFTTLGNTEEVGKILGLIWNHPSQNAYGPFGLEVVMKENGINLSMA